MNQSFEHRVESQQQYLEFNTHGELTGWLRDRHGEIRRELDRLMRVVDLRVGSSTRWPEWLESRAKLTQPIHRTRDGILHWVRSSIE